MRSSRENSTPIKWIGKLRQVKSVMHIYCEGEKTEPNYLRNYIQTQFPGQPGRRVIEIEATNKNTPVQLVDLAVAEKDTDMGLLLDAIDAFKQTKA